MFFEYEYYNRKFTITGVKEDLVKKFNEAIYDKLGLILDLEKTKKTISNAEDNNSYKLVFVVDLSDIENEFTYSIGLNREEERLEDEIRWVCICYYDKLDNQGNIELTTHCNLEEKIKYEIFTNVNDMFMHYTNNMANNVSYTTPYRY